MKKKYGNEQKKEGDVCGKLKKSFSLQSWVEKRTSSFIGLWWIEEKINCGDSNIDK